MIILHYSCNNSWQLLCILKRTICQIFKIQPYFEKWGLHTIWFNYEKLTFIPFYKFVICLLSYFVVIFQTRYLWAQKHVIACGWIWIQVSVQAEHLFNFYQLYFLPRARSLSNVPENCFTTLVLYIYLWSIVLAILSFVRT